MKTRLLLSLTVAFSLSTSNAGSSLVVSTFASDPRQSQDIHSLAWKTNQVISQALDIPYFFTIPTSSYLELPKELSSQRTAPWENLPLVLMDYREIRQEKDASHQSDLGLRLIVPSPEDSRENISHKLAESGLVQTGDIILSARPSYAKTIPYFHIQLGVTHVGVALVKKDLDGKNYVYNVDMPLNEDAMGENYDSKLTSYHYSYIDDKIGTHPAMYHILRPRGLTNKQKDNIEKWLTLFQSKAKQIFLSGEEAEENPKSPDKISFNSNYLEPNYDLRKSNEDRLSFVGDLGRLGLGQPVPQGLSMFCSEFAWSLLSLRDCDPLKDKSLFSSQKSPSCIKKIFEPMPLFGSLYESEQQEGDSQFGMSDGPIILADVIQASTTPNFNGISVRQRLIRGSVLEKDESKLSRLSAGHVAVEQFILLKNPDFYKQLLSYYDLTELPREASSAQAKKRTFLRQKFNESVKPNYSPTSFLMHALMPNEFLGHKVVDKTMDYVGTLYFLSPSLQVQMNNQPMDVYLSLLLTARNTK